ncbi:putative nuclease HARBI1 [Photinus pyralis]|uniref:putative nuclease HARBI1 n=1 Tax=Photinus pyralis TaxID=7054 RepID=UPI0012674741|nr:putative nuclease HARBI1 [Photinus pyralis]
MESIKSVANRFGISKSTCWMVLYKICNMLVQLSLQHRLIAWPSPNSLQVTSNSFQQRFGMRGVIGAIDGCHIRINAPKDHHTSYINRKGYHSVLLQAVCNADMLFTDVYTGYPGSVHDAALFKRSDLCNNISTGAAYVGEFYLLGDKAYPLQTVLMVPFKDTDLEVLGLVCTAQPNGFQPLLMTLLAFDCVRSVSGTSKGNLMWSGQDLSRF